MWHSNVSEIPPWFVPSWKLWASPSQFAPAWQVLLAFSFSSCHRNSDPFPCTYFPISSDLFTPIWWPLDLTNHIPVLGVDSIDSSSKPECSDQICTFRKVMAEGDSANAWICQVTWEKAGRRLLKPLSHIPFGKASTLTSAMAFALRPLHLQTTSVRDCECKCEPWIEVAWKPSWMSIHLWLRTRLGN